MKKKQRKTWKNMKKWNKALPKKTKKKNEKTEK